MPVRLQIVFQGGGAKLASLMAVCATIQKLQQSGIIQVTRVAGSSAGAIAAVMLASGVEIETYKERISRIAPKYIHATKVNVPWGIFNVYRGKAFFPDIDLFGFFRDLFENPSLKRVSDLERLGTAVRIYHTNLVSLQSQQAAPDTPLSMALQSSCRFPLAFCGFKSDDRLVDGGLAMNLPVDDFKKEEAKFGNVIGISFEEEFNLPPKAGLLSYISQLFSAAIQSGVSRSVLILGQDNVFNVSTNIGTFDFAKAISHGFSRDIFEGTAGRFETWLAEWMKKHAPIVPRTKLNAGKLIRPLETNRPWRDALVKELARRWKSGQVTHAESVELIDTALLDTKGDFTGLYRSICRKKFRIVNDAHILQFSFQIGLAGSFVASNLGCNITDCNNKQLNFSPHVQEVTIPGDDRRTFNVYFLFDEALKPDSLGQPYYLEYQYEGDDPYKNFGTKPQVVTLKFMQGDAENVMIALAFPRSMFPGGKNPDCWDLADCPGEKLDDDDYPAEERTYFAAMEAEIPIPELIPLVALDYDADSYVLVGRRSKNIKQYQRVGIVVE
jgi:predicted acylesterase/phospholipase RssA